MTSHVQTRQRTHRLSQHSHHQSSATPNNQADDHGRLQPASVAGRSSAPSCSYSNNKYSIVGVASNISNSTLNSASASNSRSGSSAANSRAKRSEEFGAIRARNSIDSDSSDYEAGLELDSGASNNDKENSQQQQGDKPHSVGPVMGIFFKVWSLVKVTRGRHRQQKMRRQNSEETGRFQYISGDQFRAAGCSSAQNSALPEDRHFRRAGSQPAPSWRPALEPPAIGQQALVAAGLKTSAAPARPTTDAIGGASSSNQLVLRAGANSTSSGVSSSTSSTLANSSPSNAASVKRHLSARSLRRPAAIAPASAAVLSQGSPTKQANGGSHKSSASWTSKIRRSATSVNQADLSSYTSRFRFTSQRASQQQQQQQQSGQKQQQPTIQSDTGSSDRQQQVFASSSGAGDATNSSEEDSNDIYSTPNDSIQSGPFNMAPTLPATTGEHSTGDRAAADTAPSSGSASAHSAAPAYPIIKSFSTTNFSQLIRQQASQPLAAACFINGKRQRQFAPIDELVPGGVADLQRQDSSQSAASATSNNNQGANNTKRLSGSRFFISSSSSEDSNSPNQQQQQRQQAQLAPSGLILLQQDHRQLALNQGVHFHAPAKQQQLAVSRPDSLTVGPVTPSSILISSANQPAPVTPVAASATMQSPLDCILVSSRPAFLGQSAATGFNAEGGGKGAQSYLRSTHHYRKSPSLFEISRQQAGLAGLTAAAPSSRLASMSSRFSSKYPAQNHNSTSLVGASSAAIKSMNQSSVGSFKSPISLAKAPEVAPPSAHHTNLNTTKISSSNANSNSFSPHLPNSISLHDCKLNSYQQHQQQQQREESSFLQPLGQFSKQFSLGEAPGEEKQIEEHEEGEQTTSDSNEAEYKLAQMLLEFGSNPNARDASSGCTVLMQAIQSDNLPTIKCLIERGVDLNATNHAEMSALDLACSRAPTKARLEILKLLIDNRANLDRTRESDGTRLLDRLIAEHRATGSGGLDNKLSFIDCLLQSGAKLGSATWAAANGKHEIQLRLLKKLCQDGYFLYKQCSIEAAVFRFEYALKRLAELEQQLAQLAYRQCSHSPMATKNQLASIAARQIKYQTYLGLSRCERKRRFYKRALEFAHMAILVDSTAYEGYYSKAHILKDLGEADDSLLAIDQTWRLVDKSLESVQVELNNLQQQEEQLIYEGCFNLLLDSRRSNWIESRRLELSGNLEYLREAKKYVEKLKDEILHDKLRTGNKQATASNSSKKDNSQQSPFSAVNNQAASAANCRQQQIVSAS